MNKNLIVSILLVLGFISCQDKPKDTKQEPEKTAKVNYLDESKADFDSRMQWWRDDTFGMFIHWGPYAIPAGVYKGKDIKEKNGEWIMHFAKIPTTEYELFAKELDPKKFDADQWAGIIKDAGMKYVVFTSKHHDGFAMWDSQVSDYDIVDFSTYDKDVLKLLSEACRKKGLKFGVYYSIMDWHHPDAQADTYLESSEGIPENKANFARYLEDYMKPQLKELIENYDVDILWFDGEWVKEYTHAQGKEIYEYVRSLKPDIIINNRVDKGRQGMQGMNKDDSDFAGDFGTPEQEILEGTATTDWESCMTMNDTWGYRINDHNWKSAETLIYNLIDATAKGGNYLLNVGPTPEGLIPKPSVERLHEIGTWLDTNGEAIYATDKLKGDYKQGEDIRFTKSKDGKSIYAILLEKPRNTITLKNIRPHEGSKIRLLGADEALKWTYSDTRGLTVTVPKSLAGKYAWTLKIEGEEQNATN